MPKQSNKKLVLGGAAGLFIVAVVWFVMTSGSAAQTNSPARQPTVTMTEDEPADPVVRSEPRGSTGAARLEGAAPAAVEDKDGGAVTQKSKSRRSKKRSRRKQEREEEEEEALAGKKAKKQKFYGK